MTPAERYLQVARLHIECLDRGFLATLGERFLALMYEAMDRSRGTVLLTEEEGERVTGFITGGNGMGEIYREMARRPLRLAAALAPALVRPAKMRRILEIVRYSSSRPLADGVPEAELLSLAVSPKSRGTGIAERLYRRLVAEFLARGVDTFRITVGEALLPAHRFYSRMGAEVVGELEVHGGERSKVYVHRL